MNADLVQRMGMVLGSAYPRWEANEGTWLVFARVVEDLEPVCVLAACWSWVREKKWPPAPCELRDETERWVRYLNEGPSYELVRLRLDYDHALGPEKLAEIAELAPESPMHQEAAEKIRQQTGKTIKEHLDAWRHEAAAHRHNRQRVVELASQGTMDPTVPSRLLLPIATTMLPQEGVPA